MTKHQRERKSRFRKHFKAYCQRGGTLTYPQWLEQQLDIDEEKSSSLSVNIERLTEYYGDIRNDIGQLFQECCAVLRIESTRAREHAELVTALLMHFRNKGKMPKNWRRLTIGELIGFATTLPRSVESLGEMQEIPVLSQEEARFIERFAEKKTDIGLDYYQHGHSLVRKAKSRLCVEE